MAKTVVSGFPQLSVLGPGLDICGSEVANVLHEDPQTARAVGVSRCNPTNTAGRARARRYLLCRASGDAAAGRPVFVMVSNRVMVS